MAERRERGKAGAERRPVEVKKEEKEVPPPAGPKVHVVVVKNADGSETHRSETHEATIPKTLEPEQPGKEEREKKEKKFWILPFRLNPMVIVWGLAVYFWILPIAGCSVREGTTLIASLSNPPVNQPVVESDHFQVRPDVLTMYEVKNVPADATVEIVARGRVPIVRNLSDPDRTKVLDLVSPDGTIVRVFRDGSIAPDPDLMIPATMPKLCAPHLYLGQQQKAASLVGMFGDHVVNDPLGIPKVLRKGHTTFPAVATKRTGTGGPEWYFTGLRHGRPIVANASFPLATYWWVPWRWFWGFSSPHLFLFFNERMTQGDFQVNSWQAIEEWTRQSWGWESLAAHLPADVKPYWDVTVTVRK